MYELHPYFTNDGSVGLYSPEADDIYHSSYGALSEAYEKFIIPAELDKFLENNLEIKVLDICFGIGYNTKSFLNFIFEKFSEKNISDKNRYNEAIGSNNINNKINIETIDTDNTFCKKASLQHKKIKIFINAIDNDKILFYLSPFFKTGKKSDKKFNNINFHVEKINKYLNTEFKAKYKLKNYINIILLKKIIEDNPEIFDNSEFLEIISSKKYAPFFDPFMLNLFKFYKNERSINTPLRRLSSFLHNIYYRYISARYKTALKCLKLHDFSFQTKIDDARPALKNDERKYDFVFLDAFTASKCPALWSVDFFKEIFKHLHDNGMVLTYSNSASVRNAFLHAGFYVGKIYNNDLKKYNGTIAVKNKSLIKNELSEYDLGLLKTKAGIFYRDENLNALNSEILAVHKIEVENSTLKSSSSYIKEFRRRK